MKNFSEQRRGELVIHRDGQVTCWECRNTVPYDELRHLDYYSNVQFAQCGPCADKNGEYCAVTQERKAPRVSQPGLVEKIQ